MMGGDGIPALYRKTIRLSDGEAGGLKATLYARKVPKLTSASRCLFILAAHYGPDIANIRIMNTRGIRNILVLTREEFSRLPRSIFQHEIRLHVLVLDELHSKTHGDYHEQLGTPTAKRLAAFIFAHSLQLKYFMMCDPNVESISYNKGEASHKNIFSVLVHELRQEASCLIGVRRNHYRETDPKKLAANVLMVNGRRIWGTFPSLADIFYLLPQNFDAANWAEVYYLQHMIALLFPNTDMSSHTDDSSNTDASLDTHTEVRATRIVSRQRVVAAFQNPKHGYDDLDMSLVPLFNILVSSQHDPVNQTRCGMMINTMLRVNALISEGFQCYQDRREKAMHDNIFDMHARVQSGLVSTAAAPTISATGRPEGTPFIPLLQASLCASLNSDHRLRTYQRDAILAISNHLELEDQDLIEVSHSPDAGEPIDIHQICIPTGCGKTEMIYFILRAAWALLNDGEIIGVVTSQLNLLNQLYRDFHHLHDHVYRDHARLPFKRVVKISSAEGSIGVRLWDINQSHDGKKAILLFCYPSFKLFNEHRDMKLVIFDEHQAYQKFFKELGGDLRSNDNCLVAFSATPPQSMSIPPIFSYSISDAIDGEHLAPVIIHGIDLPYSKDNLSLVIACLADILKEQYHPNGHKLVDVGSVTFLPGIPECEMAKEKLQQAGIQSNAIHSQNNKRGRFHSSIIGKRHLLAVEILRIGYHNPWISLVNILQNLSNGSQNHQDFLTQMIGRGLRRNPAEPKKICYVLTWRDNIPNILAAIRQSPLTRRPSEVFLAQQTRIYPIQPVELGQMQQGQDQGGLAAPRALSFELTIDDCLSRLKLPAQDVSAASLASSTLAADRDDDALAPGATPYCSGDDEVLSALHTIPDDGTDTQSLISR